MGNTDKQKKEVKILFILLLIIICVCGAVGYGVYSYYWAKGNYALRGEGYVIGSFGANISGHIEGNYQDILGGEHDGETTLVCPEKLYFSSPNKCYANFWAQNSGDTPILMHLYDFEVDLDQSGSFWTASEVNPSQNDVVVNPGERIKIELAVYLTPSDYTNSTGEEVSDSVGGNDLSLSIRHKMSGTQVLQ